MSTRNLDSLLHPRSVALIGASDRPRSLGATVMRNLLRGGFSGPIWPVNPKRTRVAGVHCFPGIAGLPEAPDLAVICTPAPTVPAIVAQLGARGTRAAVVLTAGLEARRPADGRSHATVMLEAARPHLLRILGPNCVGLLVPGVGLNASFAHAAALPGTLAFIAQSGALTTAMLDWARARGIGFSHFISLGNSADVDFGDLLDHLASDPGTRAILLYIESIRHARKFMSAARAAARNKPVIVVKAGRAPEAAKAAASHTGALAGADEIYDAAFRRAGMLRVDTTRELFQAAETLARLRPFEGRRLAILSNGGGPAVMATDELAARGGALARLTPETLAALDAVLPAIWSRGNPVDVIGDAPAERYLEALGPLVTDPGVDAVLFLHAPTAIVPASTIARVCAPALAAAGRPVLACWMGAAAVRHATKIFTEAGIPTYETPEEAVSAFMQMVRFRENQRQLMETPPSIPESFVPDAAAAQRLIDAALAAGRELLSEPESKQLLGTYGIPVVETRIARDLGEVQCAARELGFPVALKILSPDITHKSDVGGVALDIASPDALEAAVDAMLGRCRELRPAARLEGFTVQRMVRRGGAHELIAGIASDATFGPVILFGQGGTAVEAIADEAIALPPLNRALAADLIGRTRIARLLAGYRDRPPVDHAALELALVQLAQLAADVPEIIELDINPLLVDEQGAIALDARVRVARAPERGAARLAIRPYPRELEERAEFEGRELLLRPIRPEDRLLHEAFLARISPEDMRTRFFRTVRTLPGSELARLTQIDYEREMAFIALGVDERGDAETLGVARAHTDPENHAAEFAVLVRSDLKGRGLGSILLAKLVRYCRARGTQILHGEVLAENARMLHLAEASGFRVESRDAGCVHVRLELQAPAAPPLSVPRPS
ncbi:MAG: bifunctional acetate--CoA ligase family protein/GNAT family N-acetyltransferase [Gammaproteobacteria bacterium]|nr:bifunctional acetate--CoA ligase family protein/GNAT family N-acetyltransferase [Gammaproteobacteria bacterium]